MELLIEARADIEIANDYEAMAALFLAVRAGSAAKIKLLVETGANLEAKSSQGFTPLFEAVDRKDKSLVKLLLDLGADVEAKSDRGKSVVALASHLHQHELARFLRVVKSKRRNPSIM